MVLVSSCSICGLLVLFLRYDMPVYFYLLFKYCCSCFWLSAANYSYLPHMHRIFPFSGFLLEKDCKYDYNLPISYPMLLTG
jgi:hypothetical protein